MPPPSHCFTFSHSPSPSPHTVFTFQIKLQMTLEKSACRMSCGKHSTAQVSFSKGVERSLDMMVWKRSLSGISPRICLGLEAAERHRSSWVDLNIQLVVNLSLTLRALRGRERVGDGHHQQRGGEGVSGDGEGCCIFCGIWNWKFPVGFSKLV